MDWIGVRKLADACMCPKSLNYIIEVYSNDFEIEYSKPNSSNGEISYSEDINFGRVAEGILQYHATGKGKSGKNKRADEIRDWIIKLEDEFYDDDDLEYIKLDEVKSPWARKDQWWIKNVKFTEESVNDIDVFFEQWVRQFTAKNFDEMEWDYEYEISLNRPISSSKFLPVSGVMDLINHKSGTIIELKTTALWKKDFAKLQVMIYGDLFFRKEGVRPLCYIFHDNLLSSYNFEKINSLIEEANDDDENVEPSILSCRDCLCPHCKKCLKLIEVPNT